MKPFRWSTEKKELLDIQARALREGIPYQTLVSSVLHKYVTGRLVEPYPVIREVRYLDKLIDELAKGKAMEKVKRG